MSPRKLSRWDRLLVQADRGLNALFAPASEPARPSPARARPEAKLEPAARQRSVGLMRVNHAGEVAAQALYHGHALTARRRQLRRAMREAAREESDHLAWCETRVHELGARTSLLSPLWYAGAFSIGAAAGLAGDRWSLGFVAETERQVVRHLDGHLERLPEEDARSRAVLEEMRADEARHGQAAERAGAARLPPLIRALMRATASVMTRTAYWI